MMVKHAAESLKGSASSNEAGVDLWVSVEEVGRLSESLIHTGQRRNGQPFSRKDWLSFRAR